MEFIAIPLTDEQVSDLPQSWREPPPIITGSCARCGKCCEYFGCPQLDPNTKLCIIWPHRPASCRTSPRNKDEIDTWVCPGYNRT